MFLLSKAVWAALQPSSLIAISLGTGAALSLRRSSSALGRRFLIAGAAAYCLCGLSPLGTLLLLPLEQQTEKAGLPDLEGVAGIIVLGGAIDTPISQARSEPQLNEAAERLTEALRLVRLFPSAHLIFSGGGPGRNPGEQTESDIALHFFADFGVTPPRVFVENKSRNTAENALFTARLLKPSSSQRWLLVTSAFHMSRAKLLFEWNGFNVMPWPCDFRTGGWEHALRLDWHGSAGLRRVDLAAKEWISLSLTWAGIALHRCLRMRPLHDAAAR